jgi:hypothetical protein
MRVFPLFTVGTATRAQIGIIDAFRQQTTLMCVNARDADGFSTNTYVAHLQHSAALT